MPKDSLGDRMKSQYEDVFRYHLPGRLPIILRLDGVHWHSLTKKCKKPIDDNLVNAMNDTAIYLCKNVQGCQLAYIQSDEISLLLNNYQSIGTQGWFDNNLLKMCSVASGLASAYFTSISDRVFNQIRLAQFDCRAFVLPKEEVNNAFEWRQQDATRNSVQMSARSLYSHKECNNKNCAELQELCWQKGINWNDLPTYQKRGRCIIKTKSSRTSLNPKTGDYVIVERSEWVVDNNIPIFHKDKQYIEKYL